jgi:hypothetical protein
LRSLVGSSPVAQKSFRSGPPPPLPAFGDPEPRFGELNEALEQLSLQKYDSNGRTNEKSSLQQDVSFFENMVRECIQEYATKGQIFVFDPLMSRQKFIPKLGNSALIMLGNLMMKESLPKFSSYNLALRKWCCYILFGKTIRDSGNPCGQLSFSEFLTLLVERAGYEGEFGWKVAHSILDDDNIMEQILLPKQTPAPVTLTFLPADLQFKLTKRFIPLLSSKELGLWTLETIIASGSIQAFRLLLERCVVVLRSDQLVKLTSFLVMQVHRFPSPTAPSSNPDWRCGPYCSFYREIIRYLPGPLSELRGPRSILLPKTAIVRDLFILPSLFNAKTQWRYDPEYRPTSGFNADFIRELDFVASATGFCRAQFESDSEYRQRAIYISSLIRATIPEHLKGFMPSDWGTIVPWLIANNVYRLLDVFLENWTNRVSLRSALVLQALNLATQWRTDLEPHLGHHPLAVAQLLKYSSRFYTDLNILPPTTSALLQLHVSIKKVVEPCTTADQTSTIQFLFPPLMSTAPKLDSVTFLRAYLLYQFGIPLPDVRHKTGYLDELGIDKSASVLNMLLTEYCKLQSLQPAFKIEVIASPLSR